MGYLEIKLSLNRSQRPDLEKAAVTFTQAIERIGILVTGRFPADSAGNAIRVRAEGVTGRPEATVKGSFMPGNDRTAGMLNLTVLQHPDGPDGVSKAASELADRLLYEAGVAALPGTAFGPWGEGFLRLSYANSVANIQVALDAIKSLLG